MRDEVTCEPSQQFGVARFVPLVHLVDARDQRVAVETQAHAVNDRFRDEYLVLGLEGDLDQLSSQAVIRVGWHFRL